MNKIDIRAYILPHKLLWIGWAVDMTKNNDEGILYCDDTPLISVKSSDTPWSANEVHVSELHELEDILKPCPICGEKPRIQMTKILTNDIGEQVHYQLCCFRRCGQIRAGLSLKLLIESWNGYAEGTKTRLTIKPKTTNCPNCGAPVDIHAEKCAYCDTPYI